MHASMEDMAKSGASIGVQDFNRFSMDYAMCPALLRNPGEKALRGNESA